MAKAAGRHVARRWYTGVGVRDVVLAGSAIAFSGAILAGTVVAEQYGPNLDELAPTTLTAPPPAYQPPPTTTTPPTTAPLRLPPGAAGPPGPPGPPGQVVVVTVPVPATAPPSTVGETTTTTRPPLVRVCVTPPSRPHPTTHQKPCLPR